MIINRYLFINILLTISLLFYYPLGNFIYALENNVESNHNTVQETQTSETEQPAEEILETPKNENQEQTEEQQETTTEVTQTDSTEVEQTTTQDEENNEAEELSTEEATIETTQTESTETQEENEDTTQSADQQESDNSNEGSTGSLSQQEFLNTNVADTEAPYIINVEKTALDKITFTFNEDLTEATLRTTHFGLKTISNTHSSTNNDSIRDGATITGNEVILKYSNGIAGSGQYYYIGTGIQDLAGNAMVQITVSEKQDFYLPDHTVSITNGPTKSQSVLRATFTDTPIQTERVDSILTQMKIKSINEGVLPIPGAEDGSGFSLRSNAEIKIDSIDDGSYNFKDLKTISFEQNLNGTRFIRNHPLFYLGSTDQKTGTIFIAIKDSSGMSLGIYTDEINIEEVCIPNVFEAGTAKWTSYHIRLDDAGWEIYINGVKKTTYNCSSYNSVFKTTKLLTQLPIDFAMNNNYLFSSPDASVYGNVAEVFNRNFFLSNQDIPVTQTDYNGIPFVFAHIGKTASSSTIPSGSSTTYTTYVRDSGASYQLTSYALDSDNGTTDKVVTYIDSVPPIDIENISVTSNNTYSNGQHATVGDEITLEFTATAAPTLDPAVLIGGQTPLRDTTVSAPDFKYTLVVDTNTSEGVGDEIFSIDFVNDFGVSSSPDLSALTFSIINGTPVITTSTVNSSYSLTKINASSDIPVTMHQKIIDGSSTCDAAEMLTDATIYTSGEDISYTDESYNGFKVCFSAVTAVGKSTYKVSDIINGLDTSAPKVTITVSSTDSTQSKSYSATATDVTQTTWVYKILTSSSLCEETSLTTDTISYTEGDDIVFSSESDNGNILCFKVTDVAGFTSYESSIVSDIDTTAPTVLIKTQVNTPTKNPSIQISSTEAGTVVFSGDCGVLNAIQITNPLQGENETLLDIDLKNINGEVFVDGTYNCTVAVTDVASNTSTYLTIDTFVVDNTAPLFSSVKISSNNTNTSFAKQGDTITLTAKANEALSDAPTFSSFTIGATSVTPSVFEDDGNSATTNTYTATYDVQAGENGIVSFSFTSNDEADNTSSTTTTTTDQSKVTVDTTAPTFTTVKISSNNQNTTYAKAGDIITLTATASGALSGVPTFSYFTIGGTTVTPSVFTEDTDQTTTNTYVATYEVQAGKNGGVSFLFVGKDAAGNTSRAITNTTDGSTITIDTTVHTFTTVSISSNNTNTSFAKQGDTITLTATASETLSDVPTFSSLTIGGNVITSPTFRDDGDQSTTNTYVATYDVQAGENGEVAFLFVGTDTVGHISPAVTTTTDQSKVTVDTTAPTFTTVKISSNNQNTTYAKAGDIITLTVTASGALSDVPTFSYFTIGGTTVTPSVFTEDTDQTTTNTYVATYEVQAGKNGGVSFLFVGKDAAGNTSRAVTDTTDGSTVTIDTTAPTFTTVKISSNNTNTSYAKEGDTITLTATANEALSDAPTFSSFTIGATSVTPSVFTEDTDQTTTNTYVATYEVQAGESGIVSFSFASIDEADNTSSATTTTTDQSKVTVDTTAPTFTTVKISSDNTNTNYAKKGDTITLTATANEALSDAPTLSSFTIGATSVTTPTFVDDADQTTTNTYVATYEVQTGENGIVSFSFIGNDEAYNTSSATITTTDQSIVTVDTVDLTFTTVKISSNNQNTNYAKEGNTITLTATASGALSDVPTFSSFAIGGTSVTTPTFTEDTDQSTTNTYVATYEVQAGENGIVSFSFTGSNISGNTSDTTITTTDSSSVTADTTSPQTPTETTSIQTPTNDNTPTVVVGVSQDGTFVFGGSCATYKPTDTRATSGDNNITFQIMPDNTYSDCFIKLEDAAGNESEILTLSSFTVDTTAPTFTTVKISSDNTNTSYAKEGDTITLTATASGALSDVPTFSYFTIGGTTVTPSVFTEDTDQSTTNTYVATYEVQAGKNGGVSFLFVGKDAADNTSRAVTDTTDGSTVTIDTIVPTFTTVKISSDNTNTSYAKDGDTITLTATANEALSTAPTFSSFTIGSTSVTPSVFTEDTDQSTTNTYVATYEVQAGENGIVSFSFTGIDEATNTSTTVTTTTNQSKVTVDTTAPTFTTVSISSNNTNTNYAKKGDTITLTAKASEALSTVPTFSSFTIGATSVTPSVFTEDTDQSTTNTYVATYEVQAGENGIVSFSFTGIDEATNTSSAITSTTDQSIVTVDTVDLTFTTVKISSNNQNTNYAKEGDTITLTATASGALSDVPTFSSFTIGATSVTPSVFTEDTDQTTTNTYVATYEVQAGENGIVSFSFTGSNISGNTSDATTTTTDSSSVTADTTSPQTPTETTSIQTPTNDNTPTVVVGVSQDGTFVFGGSCATYKPTDTGATSGDNNITFQTMLDNTYSDCSIKLEDAAGNESEFLTLSSFTVDTTAPTFTTVKISSNNQNTTYAKAGDIITLTATASETLSDVPIFHYFIIGGATVTPSVFKDDGDQSTTNTYIATHEVQEGQNGIFHFSFTGSDEATNTSSATTSTTDQSTVTVDTTLPTFTTVKISSNNTNTSFAKEGDTITLTATASETLSAVPTFSSFTIGATVVTPSVFTEDTDQTTTNTYVATYEVQAGESGIVSFSFAGIDEATNTSTTVTTTTDQSTVTADTTVPTFTTVKISSNNTNTSFAKEGDTITLTATANEALSDAPTFSSFTIGATVVTPSVFADDGDQTTTNTYVATYEVQAGENGIVSFSLTGSDEATNTSSATTSTTDQSTVTVDTTLPTFTTVKISSNNTNTNFAKEGDTITLTATASETLSAAPTFSSFAIGGTTVTPSVFADDGDQTTTNTYVATYEVQAGESGAISFSFVAWDVVGNTSSATTTTTDSSTVTADTIVPTFTTVKISSDNTNTSYAKEGDTITLTAKASETLSGVPTFSSFTIGETTVTSPTFTEDTDQTTTNTYVATYEVQAGENGIVSFSFADMDAVGNTSTAVTTTTDQSSVNVDTTDPSLTINVPTTHSQSQTVTFTSEANVVIKYYLTDNSVDTVCTAAADTDFTNTVSNNQIVFDAESYNGKYLCVLVSDQALNTVKQLSDIISNIDATSPLVTEAIRINPRSITLTLNEELEVVAETVSSGGFSVTDGTTTLSPTSIAVSSTDVTLTFSSDTPLPISLSYTAPTISLVKDAVGNELANFSLFSIKNGFTLDLDSSGDYTASKDGLFLYLYTQTAYTLNDTALSQLIDSNSSLVDTKAKINDGINDDSLDLDSSGDYTASKDGLFLYLYTQTAYSLNDTALSQLIDSSSSLQGTKDNIAKFLP